ncbi:TetR/AcrR family transcriptional regulator [Nocardioides sp.]|uniref:TetR/AcrR family transcriptional regulator n=1 Tax=Nocardioides sp. TaxID=35761 RepID=UPI00271F036C|nr:TetR family transcriptional regulator [Nocardioides sp.]MDO9457625.1 TetR family transcriptional regulator [Nocardioides sp.]
MGSTAGRGERVSPNHLEKQRQIVEAAKGVIVRDGLAGCTARAVADASPLTKSAIHYYFADMDEIVEAAMASHIAAFVDRVRAAAEVGDDPHQQLVAAADGYLAIFVEIPTSLVLWTEYWIDAVRRGRTAPVEQMYADVTDIFTGLFRVAGVSGPGRRGQALMSFLIGTALQQAVAPLAAADVRAQVADLCRADPEPRVGP